MKYIFSNIIGTFVLDDKFNTVDKALFKIPKAPEEEKAFMKKYPDAKIISFSRVHDEDTLRRLISLFDKNKKEIREAAIKITKQRIRDSVTEDLLIIQTINSIDETLEAINLLVRRLREWYSYYNPEFSAASEVHKKFVEAILSKDKKQLLSEIHVHDSMGKDLGKEHLSPMFLLAKEILALYEMSEKHEKYITGLMQKNCKNLLDIAGFAVGARLLKHAGTLKKLSEVPSSTVQLYGAEKALFRHMKSGAKCPKHGLIAAHDLVAGAKNRGKAARQLADKISLAVRMDVFGKDKEYGKFLLKKLEKNK